MPRIAKGSRYTADKKKALQNLNKVELNEKLEQKTSELKEVTDNMALISNNEATHNPRELHSNRRYQELKVVRNETVDEMTNIKNQIKENTQPVRITNENVNIGLGVSASINPMSEEHEIRNQNDVKFEDVAQGDILGFRSKESVLDTTDNPNFLGNQFTFG